MPKLPDTYKEDVMQTHALTEYQANVLVDDFEKMNLFQGTVTLPSISQANISGGTVANWIINKVTDTSGVAPASLARDIIQSKQVIAVDDSLLLQAIDTVLSQNQKAVTDFKAGKVTVKMFLYGTVLRDLKGKGDKQRVMELLVQKLAS